MELKVVKKIAILREAIKKSTSESPDEADSYSKISSWIENLEKLDYEVEQKKTVLDGLVQDIKERKKYARLIYWLIVGWLITILVIIFLSGYGYIKLSDAVLITLVTTTTANIAAFFLGVIRYLFPNNPRSEIKK